MGIFLPSPLPVKASHSHLSVVALSGESSVCVVFVTVGKFSGCAAGDRVLLIWRPAADCLQRPAIGDVFFLMRTVLVWLSRSLHGKVPRVSVDMDTVRLYSLILGRIIPS